VDLARIVGANNVSSLDGDRIAYSRDSWPRDVLELRAGNVKAAPACVVWPETPEEVARILQFSQQAGVPVVPYGAGSGVCGGARPSEGGIVVDVKRMRAIRDLDGPNLRVEVEAGIIGERLERQLEARGFTLGHFPSSIVCSTLGGWLAARSAGQMSTLYGKIEDMTLGLELVSPGRVRRLMVGPRPHDGTDFNALVIGSEGTFGVITAAQLRIRPLPEERLFRGFRFPTVERGVEAIRRLLRANIRPAVVRLYDALDTLVGRGHGDEDDAGTAEIGSLDLLLGRAQGIVEDLGKRLSPARGDFAKRLRGALVRTTVKAVLGAPLIVNRAASVLPEECLLVLGFEGQRALAKAELAEAIATCVAEGAADLGSGPGEHWYRNRYNVSFKASKMYAAGVFVDTMEVAATWDRLMPLYHAVKKAIAKDAVVMAHFSHAYREGCSIYFSFAGSAADPKEPADAIARYDRIWKNALIAVHETGGTISHHHGVGESKAAGMAREHGPGGMRVLSALKEAFDPKGLINPKKLGLEVVRRPPPRRRSSIVEDGGEGGFPKEIVAAIGDRNIATSGSRTMAKPPDESALAALLRVAAPRGISVVSDQTGFRAPPGSVQLGLERLEGVSRLSEHSLFVEVEAGVIVERLERMLNAHRLTLGHVHPRAVLRTVGAALSRNLLVRRGIALGDLGDLCFAARGLLANGAPIETRPVPRSATGPELDRLLVGAQGRFGIITRATLRIAEIATHREEVVYRFPSIDEATEHARIVLHRGVRPIAARVVSDLDGAIGAFELIAGSEQVIRGQLAIVASAALALRGERTAAESMALGGRFDAVVEVSSPWTRAVETLSRMKAEAGGEAWMDFLTPEGVTIVQRVIDAESRRAATEAAARTGARVVAGSRAAELADLESFSTTTGDHWRDLPASGERHHDPFEDVTMKLSSTLDPTGVFRGR
jgi:alkyldihydroxyacetonephosphate synthase